MKPSQFFPPNKSGFCPDTTRPSGLTSLSNLLLALVAMLILSAASARAANTNFLTNPGFEQGTTGWIIVPPWTWNGPSYAVQSTNALINGSATAHVGVHGGTNAFKIWGYFQTYGTTPGAMQTFHAAAGSAWSSDGWVSTQVPDNMKTNGAGVGSRCYLQMLFLDATTNYGAPLAAYTSAGIDLTSPTNTWIYQQVNDGADGTNLLAPGGTAFVRLQIIYAQPAPSGGIYAGGSAYWDDVTLFKTSKPDPEITVQPVPVTVNYGQTATFSVTADGVTPVSYKWQKDGTDITDPNAYGVNTSTLTLSNATTAMMGGYTVTVTDLAGPLTSDSVYLMVNDPGVLSMTPPLGQTITNGGTAKITVSAAGSMALDYYWTLNGNMISDNGHYAGTTTSNLTVGNLSAADAGTYTVYINGGSALASSGLKVVSSAQLATNLLVNPGFEDGVLAEPWEAAWVKFNGLVLQTTNDFYYLSSTPVSVHGGSYVGEVYSSDADDGVYQNVPATAGSTYHAGGWFYMSHFAPVGGTVTVTLQAMFKDAGGNTITAFSASQITSNFVADAWTPLQVTNATGGIDLVAPAGTVSVTCQIYEFNWSYGGGTVYFDDLYLTRASLPAPPSVTVAASVAGGQIHLTFPSTSGVTYELLYANSLNSPIAWKTNSTIAGDGTVKGVFDPIGATNRFYRVMAHY